MNISTLQCGGRQILTSKDDPRTVRVNVGCVPGLHNHGNLGQWENNPVLSYPQGVVTLPRVECTEHDRGKVRGETGVRRELRGRGVATTRSPSPRHHQLSVRNFHNLKLQLLRNFQIKLTINIQCLTKRPLKKTEKYWSRCQYICSIQSFYQGGPPPWLSARKIHNTKKRPKSRILPPNLNNNWMTAVIGLSRHVTGWTTLRLVGGRIEDLDQRKVIFSHPVKFYCQFQKDWK